MDETLMLLLLVVVMLFGSYLAGSIPLVVNLSDEKLKVITLFGAGLLVGTALSVIVPEGIRALYGDLIDAYLLVTEPKHQHQTADSTVRSMPNVTVDHSSTIGLSLVLGFVFMMLVDQISTKRNESAAPNDRNSTATIGLVVHAAADGVALGAAATTSHKDVEMIVFLAIMLHKAPAAFGLVSFLLHEGIDRNRIRRHLFIFSLSAPLFTILTYFCIGTEQKKQLNTFNATGIAMLFSAGTFLYVATVHVLPELTMHSNSHQRSSASTKSPSIVYNQLNDEQPDDGSTASILMPGGGGGGSGGNSSNNSSTKGYGSLRNIELIILIAGALLPLLLTVDHHH